MADIAEGYRTIAKKRDAVTEKLVRKARCLALSKIRVSKNYHILDLGCGKGEDMHELMSRYKKHELYVTGVDISSHMINEAKKRNLETAEKNGHHVSFVNGDCIEYLKNCKEEEYDLVIADFLLSEVGCSDLFPLINKALKKGGRLSILTVSDDHLRNLEKVFFKFLMTNPSIPNWHSVSAAVVMQRVSKTIPHEKIIKSLHDNRFSKIESSSKPIMCKAHFDDPTSFLRWLNDSMWALQYCDFIKKDKREVFADEAAKYLEEKNVKIVGEPVRYGRPFTFTLPVYSIIAEK